MLHEMSPALSSLYYFFELLGVAVFAISGAFAATRKGMDIVGKELKNAIIYL